MSLTARTFTLVDGSIPVAASNAERLARLDDPGTVNPSEPYYTVTHTLPADIVPGTIAVTTSHSVIDLSSSVSRPNFSIVSLTQAEMDSIAGNLVPHVLYVVNG
ncbi:hypothetical protein [Pseudonocardia oroxyli]|uniref:hypothetical protein n=1 Tax=Pseudonocardia oroxyli TaxID=366584 RepID=UPI001160027C|nr:hypothetical protein [Pseudonocardia oroxyli]